VLPELAVAALLVALVWLAIDGLRAREAAVDAARRACASEGLQFLDDTVMLASMRIVRDGGGRVALRRIYHFEFSDTGDNRLAGAITLTGASVDELHLEPYQDAGMMAHHPRL
jgi:hypothetical protein